MSKYTTLLFFAISTAATSITNVFCILYVTEAETGFFIQRLSNLGYLMVGFIFLILALVFAVSAFTKPTEINRPLNIPFGAVMIVLGAALLFDLFLGDFKAVAPAWQLTLKQVFGTASAATFILFGIKRFKSFFLPEILWLIPVIFTVFELIVVFTGYASLALISQHLLDLFKLGFLLVFFLNYAKSQNGVAGKLDKLLLIPVGLCAALLLASSAISRTVVTLAGVGEALHLQSSLAFSEILFAAFIVFALFFTDNVTAKRE